MKDKIPVLLLRKLSLLPLENVKLELNNINSQKLIEISESKFGKKLIVITPSNFLEESPSIEDLPKVGTLAIIKSKIELPNGNFRIVLSGLNRVKISEYSSLKDNPNTLISNVQRLYIKEKESIYQTSLKRNLKSIVKEYININHDLSNSEMSTINKEEDLDKLTDIITSLINLPLSKKIKYASLFSEEKRAEKLIKELKIEIEILKLNNKLDHKIKADFDKEQREYILRTKIKKLNEELGISSTKEDEIKHLEEKLSKLKAPKHIKDRIKEEILKYSYTDNNSPEIGILRNYIETLLSLPYYKTSKEELNISKINIQLNKTHFAVDEVKNRIKDYASLKQINNKLRSPIICLVGPPGVGKSTLAESISLSLSRKFIKISVGGLNDSTELIGHKKTYLGASSGKIINGIKKANVNNPVLLIDEVDKMVKDYKGDPASVLLDILDYNQNKYFTDNYIEEEFNLSNVLFILTANDATRIPAALKDRLEIIHIDSYSSIDKLKIASNYLIPNINLKYNIKKVNIEKEIICFIINNYTLESGVRELSRLLDRVIRHILINNISKSKITKSYIKEVLGNPKIQNNVTFNKIGAVNILGVSPYGGVVINVETALIKNESGFLITGNAGDITKDNIEVVLSYIKNLNYVFVKKMYENKLHINFKNNCNVNGASGSLGILVSIVSALKRKTIKEKIAFTGKIDLEGNILKVNSIKEKIINAYNNNIETVYIPKLNEEDLIYIDKEIKENINIRLVSNFKEVYKDIF